MAKVTFNGPNKLIIVDYGEDTLDAKVNLYSEWKQWVKVGDNIKYLHAFEAVGGNPTFPGQYSPSYYFLQNGWRIRPYEDDHGLNIATNLYVEGGTDNPVIPTTGEYTVLAFNKVSDSPTVDTGGSAPSAAVIASAVWDEPTGSYSIDTMGYEQIQGTDISSIVSGVWREDVSGYELLTGSMGYYLTQGGGFTPEEKKLLYGLMQMNCEITPHAWSPNREMTSGTMIFYDGNPVSGVELGRMGITGYYDSELKLTKYGTWYQD